MRGELSTTPLDVSESAERALIRSAADLENYRKTVQERADEASSELARIDAILARIKSLQE